MRTTKAVWLCLLGLSALPTFGQSSVKDAMIRHWKVSGEFTIAVAETMPAADYNFRPNPEEMTFGQLMAHIALADLGACANASGLPRPDMTPAIQAWSKAPQKTDVSREEAVGFLKTVFSFCTEKAIPAATWEKLDNIQGPPNRKLTGYEWLWSYFTHTAHHRGQAEVYLRVKGLKPPAYQF